MHRIALCLFALAAFGAAADCGGGDSGPALTAEEFAKQANAICKAGDAKLAEEGKDLLKNANASPAELAKFFVKNAIPNARDKLKAISKLRPPTKDKAKVEKMLSAGRKATDTVEQGLKKQGPAYLQAGGPDPFKDFDTQAKDLKLTDCASQS
jgi:hypothetical protein